jgi:hypothetical protein
MSCRRVICAACCTRVEGVNRCHACLKALGARRDERPPADLWPLAAAGLGGLGWLLLTLLLFLIEGKFSP